MNFMEVGIHPDTTSGRERFFARKHTSPSNTLASTTRKRSPLASMPSFPAATSFAIRWWKSSLSSLASASSARIIPLSMLRSKPGTSGTSWRAIYSLPTASSGGACGGSGWGWDCAGSSGVEKVGVERAANASQPIGRQSKKKTTAPVLWFIETYRILHPNTNCISTGGRRCPAT